MASFAGASLQHLVWADPFHTVAVVFHSSFGMAPKGLKLPFESGANCFSVESAFLGVRENHDEETQLETMKEPIDVHVSEGLIEDTHAEGSGVAN